MGGVTYNMPQPTGSTQVSTDGASGAKTFTAAALLTFSSGMLMLIGYLLIGGFGVFLGIVAAVLGVLWWRSANDKMFPANLKKSSLISVTVASAVLGLIVFLMV